MRKLFFLLPAYNEAPAIKNLVPTLAKIDVPFEKQIVVCNDGSTDGSADLLDSLKDEYPLEVITHSINRGLGETIRDLFEYAALHSSNDSIVIRMDCDDTHDPVFVFSMIDAIDSGHDVVIASRFYSGGKQLGVNGFRITLSFCANFFMYALFPARNVRDYSSGYRAYSGKIIKKAINVFGNNFLQLKAFGFACTIEKLVKFKMLKASFQEVPFTLRYDLKSSESKMATSITILGYIVLAILYHWPFGGWRSYAKKHNFFKNDTLG